MVGDPVGLVAGNRVVVCTVQLVLSLAIKDDTSVASETGKMAVQDGLRLCYT
jgi:hypothetical protein